jgi:hypothetical protein
MIYKLLNIGLFTLEALVADPSTYYAIKEEYILHINDDKVKAEPVHPPGVMNSRMVNLGSIYFCEIHLHKKSSEIFFGACTRSGTSIYFIAFDFIIIIYLIYSILILYILFIRLHFITFE